ncbi:MAG: YbhN family protein [Halobacteriales archaeon]
MSSTSRRSLVLGFAGGIALMIGLLWVVEGARVGAILRRADPVLFGLAIGFALLWLVAWGLMLRTVLGAVGVQVSTTTSFFVHVTAVFANNVTPFAQAGGEPVTALLVSRVSDTPYETSLAGIASVDVLNAVSSIGLMTFGVAVYAGSVTLGSGLYVVVGSTLGFAVITLVVFLLLWQYRTALTARVAGAVSTAVGWVQWGPLASRPLSEADIADRMRGFFGSVERVAKNRRGVVVALGLSTVGWLLQAVALVTTFAALGEALPLGVALFVIPLSNLAGVTPLPGGLGGIEAALVALIVPTTGISAAVVTAAVLLFRVTVYWIPVALGGTSATAYSVGALS